MMNGLYRLFYVMFSLSCMAAMIFPLVLLLRFCMRRLPGQFRVVLWGLFFVKASCPVGMYSPVSLFEGANRSLHKLLRSLGLSVEPSRGLMMDWQTVFSHRITVTRAYMLCSILWAAGAVLLLVTSALLRRRAAARLRRTSRQLFDDYFESNRLLIPARTGMLHQSCFLPAGLSAKEAAVMIDHQKQHLKRHDAVLDRCFFVICCLHWWNLLIWAAYSLWRMDEEYACDDAVMRERAAGGREHALRGQKYHSDGQSAGGEQRAVGEPERYARDILNMQKEGSPGSLRLTWVAHEIHLQKRAERILYYPPDIRWKRLAAAGVLSLFAFLVFFTSSLSKAMEQRQPKGNVSEQALFDQEREVRLSDRLLASCETKTPSGSAVRIELVMTEGSRKAGSTYQGSCILKWITGKSSKTLPLEKLFHKQQQEFGDIIELSAVDYNEDGAPELSIGQQTKDPETDRPVQEYYLVEIGNQGLRPCSDPMFLSDVTISQQASMTFSYIQGAGGVLTVRQEEGLVYYVWDDQKKRYTEQEMDEKKLKERRELHKSAGSGDKEKAFSLRTEGGDEMLRVSTVADDSGSRIIQQVQINPEGLDARTGTRTMTDVEGYFCDLQWVQTDREEEKYAVLTYNGARGRTFVIYDLQRAAILYRQADGNEPLRRLFQQYGDKDVQFDDKAAVIYSLMEMTGGDRLKINFAAIAKNGQTVKGTYQYDVEEKRASELQFSRIIDESNANQDR